MKYELVDDMRIMEGNEAITIHVTVEVTDDNGKKLGRTKTLTAPELAQVNASEQNLIPILEDLAADIRKELEARAEEPQLTSRIAKKDELAAVVIRASEVDKKVAPEAL